MEGIARAAELIRRWPVLRQINSDDRLGVTPRFSAKGRSVSVASSAKHLAWPHAQVAGDSDNRDADREHDEGDGGHSCQLAGGRALLHDVACAVAHARHVRLNIGPQLEGLPCQRQARSMGHGLARGAHRNHPVLQAPVSQPPVDGIRDQKTGRWLLAQKLNGVPGSSSSDFFSAT